MESSLRPKGPDGIQKVIQKGVPNWLYMHGTNIIKKGGMWVPSVKFEQKTIAMHLQCVDHWQAAECRLGTLVWRAAKGRLYGIVLAGDRRPP